MTLPVLMAVTGGWEAPLVAGLEGTPHDVRVVRRCVDLADLLSAAAAGLARAAVLSADLHRLDRDAVTHLLRGEVAVVGLTDPGDAEARARLLALGVQRTLPADSAPAEVAQVVAAAVEELAARPVVSQASSHEPHAAADPADALGGTPPTPPGGRTEAPGGGPPGSPFEPGRVVAVWGPAGAPGRTTVAVTLAAEIAALGHGVVLADADTYAPSVAQVLGLLDESAGLGAAVRAANQGRLDLDRLARLAPVVAPRLRVLTGLPRATRWPELRPSGLDVVWDRTRQLAPWTIIDCGFCLESDEELSFDTSAPRRNGATLSALVAADLVLVVGAADPVGLQRLVRGLQDLGEVIPPEARRRVVVTKVRASAVGATPHRRVEDALDRFAGVRDVVVVPDDRRACDAALLAGRTLTEHARESPARVAVAALASDLTAHPTPHSPRRARRRVRPWSVGQKMPEAATRE